MGDPNSQIEKDNLIQAVIIADFYSSSFHPITKTLTACLTPAVNQSLLTYTFECLSAARINDVILFCSKFTDQVKKFLRNHTWSKMNINVVVSDECRSFGDALRDLDGKGLIRGDFILLTGQVVGSLDLISILEKHKKTLKTDKGTAMTVIYKDCGQRTLHPDDEMFIGLDADTNQIIYYYKNFSHSNMKTSKVSIPLETVLDRKCIDFHSDLIDTGICICSISVPPLFSDNFDFQTKDDFIRGLLMNEEILASTVYGYILPGDQYARAANNWFSYHTVCRDIMNRWTYPQVPDSFSKDSYKYRYGNIYLQDNVSLSTGCVLSRDVVVGTKSSVGANTVISSSIIDRNCRISFDCNITQSHLFSGVNVDDSCQIEWSVAGEGCRIGQGCKVVECILGPGVVIPPKTAIKRIRLVSVPHCKDSKKWGDKAYEYMEEEDDEGSDSEDREAEEWIGLLMSSEELRPWQHCDSASEADSETSCILPEDDTNLFFSEVMDSLSRGFEDKLPCDNLVLEVNSSRYAYNVTLREVNYFVVKSILSVPSDSGLTSRNWSRLQPNITYFMPLLVNYIKNTEAMADCLAAIEDLTENGQIALPSVTKLLYSLYDSDILSEEAILEWSANPKEETEFSQTIRKSVSSFLKWLEEEEEEGSGSSEE